MNFLEDGHPYLYGKLNKEVEFVKVKGKETPTTVTEVDEQNNIGVQVKDSIIVGGAYINDSNELIIESRDERVDPLAVVQLGNFQQEQSDMAMEDESNETFIKNKSTKYLKNEGEDGTSPYATESDLESSFGNLNIKNGSGIGSLNQTGALEDSDGTIYTDKHAVATGNQSAAFGGTLYTKLGLDPTTASGIQSFAAGGSNKAIGNASTVFGKENTSVGAGSMVVGGGNTETIAASETGWSFNWIEGTTNTAGGKVNHIEGQENKIAAGATNLKVSHIEGLSNNLKYIDDAGDVKPVTDNSHSAIAAHIEGRANGGCGENFHIEGYSNVLSNSNNSHIEGKWNKLYKAESAHVEGAYNTAENQYVHAEGYSNTVSGESAHVEGTTNQALGKASHAEGSGTKATAPYAHSQGVNTIASGEASFAGGRNCSAVGTASFAIGYNNKANATTSAGIGSSLTTDKTNQVVVGQLNKANTEAFFVVGNGVAESNRSNAFEVLADGRATVQGAPKDDEDVIRLQDLRNELTHYLDKSETAAEQQINSAVKFHGTVKVVNAPKEGNEVVRKEDLDAQSTTLTKAINDGLELKLDKAGGAISGSLIIDKNLTVNGTEYINDIQNLDVKDAMIYTNADDTLLASNSGIGIKTGDAYKNIYGIVYDYLTDSVKLGLGKADASGRFNFNEGEGYPVAVRDDSKLITDKSFIAWDNASHKLVGGTLSNGSGVNSVATTEKKYEGNPSNFSYVPYNFEVASSYEPDITYYIKKDDDYITASPQPDSSTFSSNIYYRDISIRVYPNIGDLIPGSEASGANSESFGLGNIVNANYGFAAGYKNRVTKSAIEGVALGYGNETGSSGGLVAGVSNVVNDGNCQIVEGQGNNVKGQNNVVIGHENEVQVSSSLSAVIGERNTVRNAYTYTIGKNNKTNGTHSYAFGEGLTLSGNGQVVVGKNNKPWGDAQFIVGSGTDADHQKNAFLVHADGRATVPTAPTDDTNVVRKVELDKKQDTLISGITIKTINNESILGSGNIDTSINIEDGIGSGSLQQKGYTRKVDGEVKVGGTALGKSSLAVNKGTTTYQVGDAAFGGASIAGMTEEEWNNYYYDSSRNMPLHNSKGKDNKGRIRDEEGYLYEDSTHFAFAAGELTKAKHRGSFVQGYKNESTAPYQVVLGNFVGPSYTHDTRYSDEDMQLIVGCGYTSGEQKNRFALAQHTGRAYFPERVNLGSIAIDGMDAMPLQQAQSLFTPRSSYDYGVYARVNGNDTTLLYSDTPYNKALVRYSANGTLKANTPTEDDDVVRKVDLDNLINRVKAIEDLLGQEGYEALLVKIQEGNN